MPFRRTPSALWPALLAGQQRVITRAQARYCGLTDAIINDRLRRGAWQRLLPGTFLVGPGPATVEQWREAALQYAGAGAALDGLTALKILGVRYLPSTDLVHVVVPHGRRLATPERIAVRRTRHPIPIDPRHDLPVLVLPHALVAAGIGRNLRTVRAMTADAVQRGFTTVEALEAASATAPRRGSTSVNRAISDLASGVRSAPEAEFRDLLRARKDIPEPQWNVTLALADGTILGCVDGYCREAALVHEVDSYEHHAYAERREDTERRRSRLTSYGLTVLSSTPRRIRHDGTAVVDEYVRAYQLGLRRGPAPGVVVVRRVARAA